MRRRLLMKQARLPSEYQEVEWIKGTSSTYDANHINTGFYTTTDTRIVTEFMLQSNEAFSYDRIYGANRGFQANFANATGYIYYGVNGTTSYAWRDYGKGIRHKIDQNKNKLYINDVLVNEFEAVLGTSAELRILSVPYGDRDGKARIYYLKVYEDELLVRDYVSCYRKSDNEIGMYDLCGSICPLTNSPFYTNAGTGTFTCGDPVVGGVQLLIRKITSLLRGWC